MVCSAPARLRSSVTRVSLRHRQRSEDVQALAGEIVARHGSAVPRLEHARVSDARVTSTGVAVVLVAPPESSPCVVVKVAIRPAAASSLQREGAALSALHREARLGSWRTLLPNPLAKGAIRGKAYRLDSALCGEPAGKQVDSTVVLEAAAAINKLHRRTAGRLAVDEEIAGRWVDRAIVELAQRGRGTNGMARRFGALRDELRDAIVGHPLTVGWIHGDYWLGNVLVADRGEPCGIVDWETAAPNEPPFHDVLHLLLNARRLRSRQELGEIVRRQLVENRWNEEEQAVIDLCGTRDEMELCDRHALLLYWLRQAAMHARQQGARGGYRYRFWERRNVLPVLYSL